MKGVLQDNNLTTSSNNQADDFSGGFMHVIHTLDFSISKHLEHTLVKHKQISFSQFLILVGFHCECKDALTQAKLADALMLTEATVSRHIRTLVLIGLLSKEKSSTNKKSFNIAITKQGEQAFLSAKKIICEELEQLFSHISKSDRESIIYNFTKTIELLQQKK